MPKNISTNFDEFVNENLPKKKVTKQEIKNNVFECLSKSKDKLNIPNISKLTGHKTDNVYVAVIGIKEAKSKKFGDMIYWYVNEDQKDPIINKKIKNITKTDTLLESWLKNDEPNSRKIFRNEEDYMQHNNPDRVIKKVKKIRKK